MCVFYLNKAAIWKGLIWTWDSVQTVDLQPRGGGVNVLS